MKISHQTFRLSVLSVTMGLLVACSGPQVRYGDAKQVETVNADYGSTDLQMIAEAMTRSLLQSKAISGSKDAPIVTLADVKNKTSEYIDTRVITDKIRTQLLKSGQVRFAVSVSEMQNQTEELKRQNQSGLYKNSTISKTGNMQGAQYRIEGSIASIVKTNKDVKDVYYVFNLNLINNESGLIEWADEKEIRKTATR
ncbi:penicillin-binding protein activator LpoB [Polynucleobacter asymbioticus]|jgi:uncharacterized protein (TIGR02722 family)|uniref:Penicillin-binding protein activator LpoB n=1 Tax=Polynucleobacter asymbioticus (strain DSM 18221 / CIP 109841 / QLW-P1DMWA-1) TaxID=312153 RepID=A4SYG3_POLAQ|nr:penicillin-binding protein activator LpoB [Polynucleobacter asymbioticus]ABP34527.1 membrane lipoprotein lipid attachment site [Polynucleobacter asymbioticus QLW-P1DMWA-1]APC06367.1 penicillin-binding protein activator LpoB [Polynucleobacter asymbioticus]